MTRIGSASRWVRGQKVPGSDASGLRPCVASKGAMMDAHSLLIRRSLDFTAREAVLLCFRPTWNLAG
jgi:hypothetical protein